MFVHTDTTRVMRKEQNWLGGEEAIGIRHSATGQSNMRLNTEVTEEAKDTEFCYCLVSLFLRDLRVLRVQPLLILNSASNGRWSEATSERRVRTSSKRTNSNCSS